LDKTAIHSALLLILEEKCVLLKKELSEILESTANESKSTVGDKHETGRAMAQLEQEKFSNQLADLERVKSFLFQINPSVTCTRVVSGSLVETKMGWYYISAGFGVIHHEDKHIFTLNLQAPLGKLMAGKQEGDAFEWNSKQQEILKIY
jgi:transcription elongation GreA/GreB family factor